MDMIQFSKINRARCEAETGFKHRLGAWLLSDWMTATAGEMGEAANVIKKMNRRRDGITNTGDPSIDELKEMLADELADTFIYLDLLAQAAGISLSAAVIRKFDKTSGKIGYPIRLQVTE